MSPYLADIIAGLILCSIPFIVAPIAANRDKRKHPQNYNTNDED